MSPRFAIAFLVVFCFLISVKGQTNSELSEDWIQLLLNSLDAEDIEDIDLDQVIEELTFLSDNPLNINRASADDLSNIIFLTDFQIKSLIDYRKKYGDFQSIQELQYVYGFNKNSIIRLRPFITVSAATETVRHIRPQGMYLLRTQFVVQEQSGYKLTENEGSDLEGNKYKIYQKARYSTQRVKFGMVNEKDAGESFFQKSNKHGFDYNSFFVGLTDKRGNSQLLIGDYLVRMGQGANIWQGYNSPKGSSLNSLRKKGDVIKPNTGSNENGFMRGIATSVDKENISFTAFYSQKSIDANMIANDSGEINAFSSFQTAGLHATENQIRDEKKLEETLFGGTVGFTNNWMKVGVNYFHFDYNNVYEKNLAPYNQFEYSGNSGDKISIDYFLQAKRFNLFGEHVIANNKSVASVGGINYHLQSIAELSLLIRDYPRNYIYNYANAFSENSKIENEQGVYLSFEYKFIPGMTLFAYADYYRFPWLRYGVNVPSAGREYFCRTSYWLNRETEMIVTFRNEAQYANTNPEEYNGYNRSKFYFTIKYSLNDHIRGKNGILYSAFNDSLKGYFLYQDLYFSLLNQKARIYARYALFDTDDYNTRIYTYENDVLYAFSVPMFYQKGSRVYLMLNYRFKNHLQCWMKYSQTFYSNLDQIGTKPFEIEGSRKGEVKMQVMYRF